MRRESGFTLIEIMIVVAIITAMAALAISSMLRARHNANEAAAIAATRTILNGIQNYYVNSLPHAYPNSLADLATPTSNPPYIDSVLASGTKQGYTFTYNLINSETFTLNAEPVYLGKTGTRRFYADETGVIRANQTGQAGPNDPPIP